MDDDIKIMYSDRLVNVLNEIAKDYRGKLEAAIKAVLSQARYTNTGRGVQSVKVEVVTGNASQSPALVVQLDDYVLLLDRSKMQWTKLANVKNLIEWAKTKRSTEREWKALAWATAVKKKNTDAWKPKKWRKKGLGQTLRDMNAEMIKAFEEAIEQDWQEGINQAMATNKLTTNN